MTGGVNAAKRNGNAVQCQYIELMITKLDLPSLFLCPVVYSSPFLVALLSPAARAALVA
jgi:hypothetical protein